MDNSIFITELLYLTTLSIVRYLLNGGRLTADEYTIIDTILTERFKPTLGKLLSEYPLI